ncbi:MAG: peptide chain release factor 1 [Ignavibacteriales bacterium]
MFSKLEFVEKRYEEINKKLSDPDVIANQDEWRKLMKEHSEIEDIVQKFIEYKKVSKDIKDAQDLLQDKDMKELAEMELAEAQEKIGKVEEELKFLLLPKDPNDDKNVIVEIRGGAGGDEAALFAGVLFRMYCRYAEANRWKTEIMSSNPTGLGGFKEVIFMIEGKGAYSKLKFESGVHRVQRVPETEASGRIHTSTVTVAVLPEAEEVEVEINQNDLRIDVFRAGGPGGQCVNTTDSAVRITHIPTGIVVSCQDEKSQLKNKDKGMRILRARVYEKMLEEENAKLAQERKSQVGTGDRSERIRTYNFPQGRITDHRIGLTLYKLDTFVNGEIDDMIDALITNDRSERLRQGSNE